MGNNLPASPFGNIYLKTNNPFYCAGENVTGEIYLNLTESFPGNTIYLKIKGKEECEFMKWKVFRKTIQMEPEQRSKKIIILKVATSFFVLNSQFMCGIATVFNQDNIVFLLLLSRGAIWLEVFVRLNNL